jgi:hypothetical protein
MIKNRRIGKFKVSNKLLRDATNTGSGANLFVGMIVLDIQHDWIGGDATYVAWHPDFEPIDEGRILPLYVSTFQLGQTAPTWVKVEGT